MEDLNDNDEHSFQEDGDQGIDLSLLPLQMEVMAGLHGTGRSEYGENKYSHDAPSSEYDFKGYIRQKAISQRKEMIRNLFNTPKGHALLQAIKARVAHYIANKKHRKDKGMGEKETLPVYIHRLLAKICRLRHSKANFNHSKFEDKEPISKDFCSEINSLIKRPKCEPGCLGCAACKDDDKSVCTEESVENSLSVDTSDLDEIEAEYYFDQAVDRKVYEMNQHFHERVVRMTQSMLDRVEEPSSSDDDQRIGQGKRDYSVYQTYDNLGQKVNHKRIKTEDDFDFGANMKGFLPPTQSGFNNQYMHRGVSERKHKKAKKNKRDRRKRRNIDVSPHTFQGKRPHPPPSS